MNPKDLLAAIPDVQGAPDARRIAIDQVGIRGLRYPVHVLDALGRSHATVATVGMFVALPESQKGAHMSRFVEVLQNSGRVFSPTTFAQTLLSMLERLEAREGSIEMRFPYFIEKRAPVSGAASLMDYEVVYAGRVEAGAQSFSATVQVPVTSLCPCSKEISDYGAHNQRSHVTITTESTTPLAIEEIVAVAEQSASSELYGVLKRPDEKFVTERAYDNPKFVEDLTRDVAQALDRDPRVKRYVVEVENFESIHNHSAYARIARSKP